MDFVEHSTCAERGCVSALETHEIKSTFPFEKGEFSVVDFNWAHSTTDVWVSNNYFVNMAVTGRAGVTHATYLDGPCGVSEKTNRVMFVPPNRAVRSGTCEGTQRTILCALEPRVIDSIVGTSPEWSRKALSEGLNLNSPMVELLLLKIYDELIRPGFGQAMMIECLADALALALIRSLNLHEMTGKRSSGGLPAWRMRMIRERIHSDQALPQLKELAELCGMSVRHLTRAFRSETNMTIAQYVENAMATRARAMIENSTLQIDEIAQYLGFSSGSSFTYAFRRSTGVLPSQLRR